jgi:tetratricopeptide (TPR) repeat protein
LANRKAAKLNALQDAMSYFEAAMALSHTAADNAHHRLLRVSLLVDNVFVFLLLNQLPFYYNLLLKHEPMAATLENSALLGGFYARKALCEMQFGRTDNALASAKKAIDLCEACGNALDAGIAYMVSQWALFYKSEFEAVLALKEKVIQSHQKVFFLQSYVYSFCASSVAYGLLGWWDEAVRDGEIALKATDEHSDASLSSFAHHVTSMICCQKGDIARAIELAEMAVRKASSPADTLFARGTLAWVYCRAGQPEKDLDYLAGAVREFRKMGSDVNVVVWGTNLGEGYLLNYQYDEAKKELKATLQLAEIKGVKFSAASCHYLLGKISLITDPAQKKTPSAKTRFEKAISICREIKAENRLAVAYAGLGRYYKLQGDAAAAREYLNQALEIFERLGTLLEPEKVREELAELTEV